MTEFKLARRAGGEPARAARLAIQRAAGDLRRGEAVVIAAAGEALIAMAAELALGADLARLRGEGADLLLALTGQRAAALGLGGAGSGAIAVPLAGHAGPAEIVAIADPSRPVRTTAAGWASGPPVAGTPAIAAAIRLMAIARLLPAALVVPLPPAAGAALARERDLILVEAAALARHDDSGAGLALVGEARVPLAGAEQARLIAFRPEDGGNEHLAILIGERDPHKPVLARIHSECFTGDFLGSLRCDCGDQLRGAVAQIGAAGSGVLLYLAQEGRGIGLVNKLKAYELQDRGADTVEANRALGFAPDERVFRPAALMLQALGMTSVRLMTNNPAKVEPLARHGIRVVERVALRFPANGHNGPYLKAKAQGLGHLI